MNFENYEDVMAEEFVSVWKGGKYAQKKRRSGHS